MGLTAGIVGLPNVGKSTLFNAITQSQVEAANYPFATIQPNVGVVEVPDERIEEICSIFKPRKTIYTTFEFTDIAGLVKGASKGEGLGNQFLSHIRQTDAICEVVRCFDDDNITHVEGSVDPIRDIEIVGLELIMADLQSIENRLSKVERKAQAKDKEAQAEYAVLVRVKETLVSGHAARSLNLNKNEAKILAGFQLLTAKPIIYVANMAEDEVGSPEVNRYYQLVKAYAIKERSQIIPICARIEEELSSMERNERKIFLEDLGIKESGLDQVIKSAYYLLGLKTFFTAGEPEVRAWTFKDGMLAPECAGIIHSDFERGFIRAETYHYHDLITYKSEAAIKQAGKMRLEGKEYLVQDGDVMHFLFNV
ncbi:MAG: redox-regulated ATPase YchF [Erysipelotrichaceae bacterium]|nr:redox-regulated ATPase YchF [Erysipelotrichaceae bacterium]